LSNGKGNEPLVVPWKWTVPKQVEIGWKGDHYELRATYCQENEDRITGDGVAGIDLGEIHPATTFDGKENVIYNGRLLRSKRQYQNKIKARLAARLATKQQGSRRWRTIKQSKDKQLRRLKNQLRDVRHKLTRALVSTLLESGVQTLVIGDVRDIRTELNYGKKVNQKLHQWTFGQMRHMLSYKWEALGGAGVLHEERGTSSTCPRCRQRRKPSGRVFRCPCGFFAHRDAVGSINIRNKYQDFGPVVGAMAPPLRGVRFHPHLAGNSAV
jgi:putative transposase